MMTSSMTTVLAISFLLQLIHPINAEDPMKIFLILDNNVFDKLYRPILKDLAMNPIQLTHDGKDFTQNIPNDVKQAGWKILYISAKFQEDTVGEKLTWGAGSSAEDLAKIVSKLFSNSPEVFVTVVFPEICVKTYWGYNFVDRFENKVQESNKNIGVGIPRVKIYLFADLEMPKIMPEIESETGKDSDNGWSKTRNSIFFKLEGKQLALFSNKNEWIQETDKLDSDLKMLQKVKIQEAELVIVDIKADCGKKYDVQNVANAVSGILGTKRHEHQRIQIQLSCQSENTNTNTQEQQQINELIGKLKQQLAGASIYGERPHVVIHLATKDFSGDVEKKIRTGHGTQSYALYKNSQTKFEAENKAAKIPTEVIKSAKEISLQINCHSNFELDTTQRRICGMVAADMAEAIKNLFTGIEVSTLNKKRIELVLYACNTGTTIGKTYVETFLKNLNEKPIIDEVISFVGWVSQVNNKPMITVPTQLKFYSEDIIMGTKPYKEELNNLRKKGLLIWQIDRVTIAHEHAIYGRFTVRTQWDGKKHITFPVLPATEYEVNKFKRGSNRKG